MVVVVYIGIASSSDFVLFECDSCVIFCSLERDLCGVRATCSRQLIEEERGSERAFLSLVSVPDRPASLPFANALKCRYLRVSASHDATVRGISDTCPTLLVAVAVWTVYARFWCPFELPIDVRTTRARYLQLLPVAFL